MAALLVLSALPSAIAQENVNFSANSTLPQDYSTAEAFVNVTLVEPEPGFWDFTGLATYTPFDFVEFFSGMADIFSGMFSF
jgi:hypothetical protein